MSCGVSYRRGLDLVWLWLWCRPGTSICCRGSPKTKKKKPKKQKKRVGIFVLFLNLLGRLSVFHPWLLRWLCVCHKWPLLCRGVFPLYPLWWVSIINGYWILSNALSVSIEMIIWVLFFLLLICCVTLIDLHILNHPCDCGMNPTWSLYMILFRFNLLIFCWGFLHLYSSMILVCNFLFL